MVDMKNIILGNEKFKQNKFKKYEEKFIDLVEKGQKPKVLFIGCSDSRVLPHLITNTGPGDLFIVRNIGNFVAPFKPDEDYHSTAAAIEYAVTVLKVSEIIVCGHSHCGAIAALYNKPEGIEMIHVRKWLDLGNEAKTFIETNEETKDLSHEKKLAMTEKVSVIFQLTNLLTYPKIKELVDEGRINLRGWYYKIESGDIEYYNEEKKEFVSMGIKIEH